ncbi:MAG: aldehyde dehydrogenase [Phycisphaerae bacterium]|nr:MAG: aldehyde dehydrogenase [Phycisphaerae bacterium]
MAAPERLDVLKTYKLYIDGKFPRSESGRTWAVADARGRVLAHVSRASRKDLREAVEAARKAQPGWGGATAYLRGQILYRMAEMLEGKREELAAAIAAAHGATPKALRTAQREVSAAIDRLVHFAGWADKFSQVLGCHNPVAGPYYNFTIAEPTGVVAVVPPDEASLLALVSLAAPALCAGNAVVALCSGANPIPAAVLGEVCATSDLPPGVLNILTGTRDELLKFIAEHRDVDAVHAANLTAGEAETLRLGAAENLKRVRVRAGVDWNDVGECHTPWWIEPLVEMKTIWHPSSA